MTLSYEIKQGDIHDRFKFRCHLIQSATTSIQDSFTSKDPAQQRAEHSPSMCKTLTTIPSSTGKGKKRRKAEERNTHFIPGRDQKWYSWRNGNLEQVKSHFLEAFFCFVGLFFLKRSVIRCAHVCSCACRGSITFCPFPGNRVSHWTKILCWPPAGERAWTFNPPVSTSRVLGFQACLTTPST